MNASERLSHTPSLRTTRSRTNPTVTLYSLDPQLVVNGEEDHAATDTSPGNAVASSTTSNGSEEKSRFFITNTKIQQQRVKRGGNIRGKTTAEDATPRKRRKLVNQGNTVAEQMKVVSPTSASSSLSPPPHVGRSSFSVTVKPEPPATPVRRSTRAQNTPQTNTSVKAESSLSPLKSVKEALAPPARTPRIKKESTATPRPATPIKLKLEKPHPEPPKWRRQYELIEKMREKIVAPVDTLYVVVGVMVERTLLTGSFAARRGCETPNRERSDDPKVSPTRCHPRKPY